MGAMRYKPSDRVRIKSIDWYNENKDEYGDINCPPCMFVWVMCQYCGKILTINSVDDFDKTYKMTEDAGRFNWTDEMIEGLVEEETLIKLTGKAIKNNEMVVSIDEYILPQGYQFVDENGNVINATKIVLEKKKSKYPKTYEECCKVLDFCGEYFFTTYEEGIHLPENDNIVKIHQILKSTSILTKLIICRNAYWKIAGEEMGLGKPWEPDWNDGEWKWCMSYSGNYIEFDQYKSTHHILTFPTEEMRDAFYENFKEEIEECKELL